MVTKMKNGKISEEPDMALRSDPINVFPSLQQDCAMCRKPMTVAQGQIARFHSKCRTKVRKFKNQGKPN